MSEGALPAGWVWASFSDVADIAANLVSPADLGALPHIAPDNIERENGRLLPYRTVAQDGMTSAKHRFRAGQILYSKIRPYLNKCIRVGFEGLCSADMYPVDPRISPRYLHSYMLTRAFVAAVSEASGSRTVLPKINQQQLLPVQVPVAPLPEQERVADAIESHVSRLDDAIASLERVKAKLKSYRASVLKAAVEGRLVPTEASLARAENRSYEPASVLLGRILAERRRRWAESGRRGKYEEPTPPDTSNLRDLPEGWCWATMSALTVTGPQNGIYVHKSLYGDGVPILRIDDFQVDWSRDSTELQKVELSEHDAELYRLNPGDIVVNRVNSMTHLGKSLAVLPRHVPCVFESNMMRFGLGGGANPEFIQHYLTSADGRARLIANAKWAVNQASINQGDVGATVVPLPPSTEQTRIVAEIDRLFSAEHAAAETRRTAKVRTTRLRQSILKWAFEGKLVDQDPSDEPADVLLARIRREREASASDAKPKTRKARRAS